MEERPITKPQGPMTEPSKGAAFCDNCGVRAPLQYKRGDFPKLSFCTNACREEYPRQKLLPAPRVITLKEDSELMRTAMAEPVPVDQQETKPMKLAQLLECPKCKSESVGEAAQDARVFDTTEAVCMDCGHAWEPQRCRVCKCEIRVMCHLSKMLCAKCDADIRDRTKAMEEDPGPYLVPDSIQLTAEMGRAMRQQAIDTLKVEGFIVLSPKEIREETSCIHNTIIQDLDKKLTSHQEVLRYVRRVSECPDGVSLRDWIEDKMTENRELVAQVERMKSESAAGDTLIDAGGHQLKKAEERNLKLLLLLKHVAAELGHQGNLEDLAMWAQHREQVIRKQRQEIERLNTGVSTLETALARARDSAETYKKLHAKEASVELPQSLWERLFIWCLTEVNERVEMSDAIPGNVQGAAMVRTAMRTADELWASAVDYRKNPTKPTQIANSCVHSWLEWRGHNDAENAGRFKCTRCGVFKDEVER